MQSDQPTNPAVSQSAHANPVPQTAAPSGGAVMYESNPFRVSISGLITLLKVNPISSLLVGLFALLLMLGVGLLTALLAAFAPALGIFVGIVGFLCIIVLTIGASIALADRSLKGEEVKTSQLFNDASSKFLPLLGATVLVGLAVLIGLFLLVVPGLIFGAWFSLTYFVIFHENLSVVAAMKRSRELVKGHVWEMLGAVFAGSIISGGGSGLIAVATTVAPLSGRYEQLKTLKTSGQEKPKVHWLNYFLPIVVTLLLAAYIAVVAVVSSHTPKTTNDPFTFDNQSTNTTFYPN